MLCMVKVRKRDQQEFEQVMRKLDFNLATTCGKQYAQFKEELFQVITNRGY